MKLLGQLLDAAVAALPDDLRNRVVIFGSSPMVLAGLKPDVKTDLDLLVSCETFGKIANAGFGARDHKPGVSRIALADNVEVYMPWLGVEFPEVFAASAPCAGSRGLRVASLEHVLFFKLASNRPKDQDDIALLRRALSS